MGCCAFGLSRHGRTVRVLLGRAQAVCVVHGLARHGPTCRSGQAGPTDLSLGMVVPGWATHLAIYTWSACGRAALSLPRKTSRPHEPPVSALGIYMSKAPSPRTVRFRVVLLMQGPAVAADTQWEVSHLEEAATGSGGWPAQPDHPGAMYIGSSVTLCVTFHILHQIRQFLLQDIQILCNLFIY